MGATWPRHTRITVLGSLFLGQTPQPKGLQQAEHTNMYASTITDPKKYYGMFERVNLLWTLGNISRQFNIRDGIGYDEIV